MDPFSQEEKKGSLQGQTEGKRCIEESRQWVFGEEKGERRGCIGFLHFSQLWFLSLLRADCTLSPGAVR